MFLTDCWLQLHDNKLLIPTTATVSEKERPDASVDINNMSLVVFFTSDFDNRSAGLRLKKLTDWIVQWWPDVSALQIANWMHIVNHKYYAIYCATVEFA